MFRFQPWPATFRRQNHHASSIAQNLGFRLRPMDGLPRRYSWATIFLVSYDVAVALISLWLAHTVRSASPSLAAFVSARWKLSLVLPPLTVATLYYFDVYNMEVLYSRWRALVQALKASLVSGAVFLLTLFLLTRGGMQRAEAISVLGALTTGVVSIRLLMRSSMILAKRNVVVLGDGTAGQEIAAVLEEHPGYVMHGFLEDRSEALHASMLPAEPSGILGPAIALEDIVKGNGTDLVVITEDSRLSAHVHRALRRLEFRNVGLMPMARLYEMLTGRVPFTHLGEHWYADLGYTRPDPLFLMAKRSVDILVATALAIVTAPLMLVAALIIKLTSPGPVFYSQERVGLCGKPFRLWKFRSMRCDAEKETGPVWAARNDPRITPIGRVMRKTRIDELPQLWNVLRGEMSLIGPRPERPIYVDRFSEQIPFYEKRLGMRPGLSGWAQVNHHYDETEEDVATKLQYDLYYVKNWSLLLDLQICIKTVATVLTGHGAR